MSDRIRRMMDEQAERWRIYRKAFDVEVARLEADLRAEFAPCIRCGHPHPGPNEVCATCDGGAL